MVSQQRLELKVLSVQFMLMLVSDVNREKPSNRRTRSAISSMLLPCYALRCCALEHSSSWSTSRCWCWSGIFSLSARQSGYRETATCGRCHHLNFTLGKTPHPYHPYTVLHLPRCFWLSTSRSYT